MKTWMIALGLGLIALPAEARTFGLFVCPTSNKQGFNICYRQFNAFSPAAFGNVVIDGMQNSAPQMIEGPIGPIEIQGIPATRSGSRNLVGPINAGPVAPGVGLPPPMALPAQPAR